MKRIKEVIVVEGSHDEAKLKKFFDCDTIATHGLGLSEAKINEIEAINKTRGVILFLDPDAPGEKIRQILNQRIKGLKNAFIDKKDAHTAKKVGIEHADEKTLREALAHLLTYETEGYSLRWTDYLELGLAGGKQAALRREYLGRLYHIGKGNAKTMYKRLNMLKKDRSTIENDLKRMEDK